jgi:branched-subunit amino acid aminotransferase/4-amino-4-deoxychorismate lyase
VNKSTKLPNLYAYACFNGALTPSDEVHIPANDLGLLRGYGVFDYFRTYHGKPFLMKPHINRLFGSAGRLNLPLKFTKDEIAAQVEQLVKRTRSKRAGKLPFVWC